ncbi:Serine/threonine-protein kinase PBS1 isoform 3 [Theobroma cacao]|uniref:Serine/threonine-protein kinase PBS1 isoform 3 n=1 Tax=Theobroma cacao TaxID=3641 RepID=A0A061EG04_THECC|nr:Serine/threonine-protein kinase PBS1 isoform 3 [Theobroma cacao]
MVHKGDLVAIGISVGLALGILLASLVFFGLRWYKKRANLRRCSNERSVTVLPIRTNGLGTSTDFSASLSNPIAVQGPEYHQKSSPNSWWSLHSKDHFASASGLPKYSYKDVQKATQTFTTILGEGSFGPVYKATMPTGGVVAVKVLASNSHQGEKEFHTEVCLLGRLHHRNLVNLVGYCVDKGQRMLIYEFMSNGSLANILYSEGQSLSWEATMSPDGVDEILDNQLVGKCKIEEVRELAKIAHKCLHNSPRKRPSIGEVTQAILKIKQRRLAKEDTMSLAEGDFSRIMSRIQDQHIELTKLASLKETS